MQLSRVRISVLGLMMLVALSGSILWVMRQVGLSEASERRSLAHIRDEQATAGALQHMEEEIAKLDRETAEKLRKGELTADEAEAGQAGLATVKKLLRERLDTHIEYRRKYERASAYPWMPVAPEPVSPESIAVAFTGKVKTRDIHERTAIYLAACAIERARPGYLGTMPKVRTSGNEQGWTVTFIDPDSEITHNYQPTFSESTVAEYLARAARQSFK
jgi:hypothetical protein